MSHLSLETIARLVDEQPSALDNAHLEACATCRAELQAMRADVAALGALDDADTRDAFPGMRPAAESWNAIEARLEAEGLLRARTDIVPIRRRTWSPLARAAAVAAVFLGGTVVGHALNGSSNATSGTVATNTATPSQSAGAVSGSANGSGAVVPGSAVAGNNPSAAASAASQSMPQQSIGAQLPSQPPRSVRLASTGNATHVRDTGADKTDDASLRTLRDAEDKYFSALKNYSAKAGTETSDPNARLAALEGIVLTTGAALTQSPTDPVINGYHLTALAQRDAMLKQIKATPAKSW
jgi:hypothetical protein